MSRLRMLDAVIGGTRPGNRGGGNALKNVKRMLAPRPCRPRLWSKTWGGGGGWLPWIRHWLWNNNIMNTYAGFKTSIRFAFLFQMDRTKAVKAQLSGDHRRQSVNTIKKRRPSIHLERRGTVRRDSKLPFLDAITKDLLGEGVTKQDGNSEELATDSLAKHDGSSKVLEAENVEAESETKQERSLDSTAKQKDETITGTDQRDTTNTTQQSPPAARINTFFPDQKTPGDDLGPVARVRSRSFSVSTPRPVTVESSKWSTLRNFVESLRSHRGGDCSQVMNEVKSIVEGGVAMTPEDQIKEQITITAQHAIDSKFVTLLAVTLTN